MKANRKRAANRRKGRRGAAGPRQFRPRLKPLTWDFEGRLADAFAAHDKMLWVYYYPFLDCYGRTPRCSMLYTQSGDSHLLFLEREMSKGLQLDLFIPPIPLTREAIEFARRVIGMRPRPRAGRILWVDEADGQRLREWGMEVLPREEEYLLEPARIVGPEADLPKRLRKKIRHAEEQPLSVRPFSGEHREAAFELVEWLAENQTDDVPLLDYDYTVECIARAHKFMERGMIGLTAVCDDEFVGFAFGGPMTPKMANFFIVKTDPEIDGLAEWMRVEFLRSVAHFPLVNDASDLGRPGLAQHKRQFLPVRMLPAFTVRDIGSA